jgi:hypothetical protein
MNITDQRRLESEMDRSRRREHKKNVLYSALYALLVIFQRAAPNAPG